MTDSNNTHDNELFLVDGSGFIFRAYYAMAYSGRGNMTNPDGVPVSAVYGFTQMLHKMLRDYHAPYMAVIFDAARENFRNDIYPEYKANRDETPEDLKPQFGLIREATEAFDIPALELAGYEADDLIATYARLATEAGKKVVIVSSDKDLMQLVNDNVRMLDPMKDKWIGIDEVHEKFGVAPDRVVDVQSLAGDSVDNVPGVPGIGLKTAAQLINEYGSLEELLSRAGEIKQPKRREKLINHADDARVSQQLVRLEDDAPVPVALDELKTHDPDKPDLIAFLQKQGFKSILKRLGAPAPETPEAATESAQPAQDDPLAAYPPISDNVYELVNTMDALQSWIDAAYAEGTLCFDTETTSLTPAKADLVGVSLCVKPGKAAYIPLSHKAPEADLLGGGGDMPAQLPKADVIAALKPVLEDESVIKIAHNAKYDWQMLAKENVHVAPCDDTMMMSYALDGTAHSHGMDNLSALYLDHAPIKYEDVAGKGKKQVTFDYVDIDKALDYAAEDTDITLRLYKLFKPRLAAEKMSRIYEDIDRPLIPVIAQMELDGVRVDPQVLHQMSEDFEKKLRALETQIHDLAGREFNIASPKQVAELLFGDMELKGGKKTKSGEWSTSASVLEKLAAEGHEIVERILDYRQLSKLKSTYTDALQAQINPATGRVHSSFAIAHTATGRFSSSDPNLQNIPIRTEEGRKIREAFIPADGHTLMSVDYSQVELRLAAAMAGISALKEAFLNGGDIHALTASQVFGVPLEDVTPDLRRSAKAVNFGIIYGISGFGLSKQLGVSVGEASGYIKSYLDRFSELRDFMDDTKAYAKDHEYVLTAHGRKCTIRGINDKNGAVRAFAERQAINAPLQGTAADIMRIAMARVPAALQAANLRAKMLIQVHDELVFEVPEDEVEATSACVRDVMESAASLHGVDLGVPLIAEAGQGDNWAQAH